MWNESENQIMLVLIRHGQTRSNKEHRYLGRRTDESLSPEGIEKLRSHMKMKRYPKADVVFSSPMKRCRETAKMLYPEISSISIPQWEEMDFGLFEGKNYTELEGDRKYQAWIDSNGTLPFPEGESREEFILRSVKGLEEMAGRLKKMREKDGVYRRHVSAIVHGGTIMSLLSSYCKGDYFDYQIPAADGYSCRLIEHRGIITLKEVKRIGE